MLLSDLSQEALEKIRSVRFDRIIEKHEGPENWEDFLRWVDPEFLMIEGHPVLLPIERSHRPNITILRTIISQDGNSLTIFLKDTTYYGDDPFSSGFLAVCDRVVGEEFYLVIVYHEWFIIDPPPTLESISDRSEPV